MTHCVIDTALLCIFTLCFIPCNLNWDLLLQTMNPISHGSNPNRFWMTNRNTVNSQSAGAKVFMRRAGIFGKSNLHMHRMKIWGNKVLAENNKVKKDNGIAPKWNDFFYVLKKKFWQVYLEEWLTDCRATLLKKCKALMKVFFKSFHPAILRIPHATWGTKSTTATANFFTKKDYLIWASSIVDFIVWFL